MAITFLNSTGTTIGTAASTWSMAPHSSIEGGGAFIVSLGLASSGITVSTITDNVGAHVYKLAKQLATPRPAGVEMWYLAGLSSLSTRISMTLSGNSSGTIGVAHFRGISTNNALSVTGSSAQNANSTVFGASEITPPTANQVAVSFAYLQYSTFGAFSNLGGMTTWLSTAANGMVRGHGMYTIQGAASTISGGIQVSSRGLGGGVIAAFSDTFVSVLGWPSFAMLGVQ